MEAHYNGFNSEILMCQNALLVLRTVCVCVYVCRGGGAGGSWRGSFVSSAGGHVSTHPWGGGEALLL